MTEMFHAKQSADLEQAEAQLSRALEAARLSLEPLHRIDPALEHRVFVLHAGLGAILDTLRDRG